MISCLKKYENPFVTYRQIETKLKIGHLNHILVYTRDSVSSAKSMIMYFLCINTVIPCMCTCCNISYILSMKLKGPF